MKIELLKGGVVNQIITTSNSIGSSGTGSYEWTIPQTQILGTNYQVRVTSTTNNAYTDTSDGNFAIVAVENQASNQPIELNQFKSDGAAQITVGGATDEHTVVFSARVSDPDGDKVKLQVELRRLDEYGGNFDETQGGLKELFRY